MAEFETSGLNLELLAESLDEFDEHLGQAERLILELEREPENEEKLRALFRSIHTVKGNFGITGLTPVVELFQELEDVLHLLRQKELKFEAVVGDLTLLFMDKASQFLHQCLELPVVDYEAELWRQVGEEISRIHQAHTKKKIEHLKKALTLLDPATALIYPHQPLSILEELSLTESEDLNFFHVLAENAEQRADFWQGRSSRVPKLLVLLNRELDYPVSDIQLVMASTVHDLAMAMLPSKILHKLKLEQSEFDIIQAHVNLACDILGPYKGCEEALAIVAHHHENWNGTGYPQGLIKEDIHVGARMLSVVHAYEAITHGYTQYIGRKRPLMRAIMELSRYSGEQFDPKIIELFIKIIKELQPA